MQMWSGRQTRRSNIANNSSIKENSDNKIILEDEKSPSLQQPQNNEEI